MQVLFHIMRYICIKSAAVPENGIFHKIFKDTEKSGGLFSRFEMIFSQDVKCL